jgi:hypothetical protein
MPQRSVRVLSVAALITAGAAVACNLDVTPPPQPDIKSIFGSAAAIEQTIATAYRQFRFTPISCDVFRSSWAISLEGTGIGIPDGTRAAIPRQPLANSVGSPSINCDNRWLGNGARLIADAVQGLESLKKLNGTLGSVQQDLRARAFGFLNLAANQAYLAMWYDSVAIVTPWLHKDTIPALSGAFVAMDSAIAMLDSAIAVALSDTTTGGFSLPATWFNTSTAVTRDDFVRIARSFRARFRAGVARTPAQRAAVDWAKVIADADSGITSDFFVIVSGQFTGTNLLSGGYPVFTTAAMAMPPFYYGMADVSGAYDAWLTLPLAQRDTFLIQTPDLRWPQGATRAAQQTASVTPTSFASRPYIRHRNATQQGQSGGVTYLVSWYQWVRNEFIRTAPLMTGPYPEITKAEMNLLAAEGYYRTGNLAVAASRIDITRVGRGGLPAVSGVVTTTTQPVPGGASCVPRVPQGPAFTTTACGTLFEALKWEKRMETAWTGFAQWFFDSRGWGDLPENSAYEFPVPYQEMQARGKVPYSLGGGLGSSAPKGTYGF